MFAVARHMLDYTLPAPFGIHPPGLGTPVSIALPPTAVDAWLDTMIVDAEEASPVESESPVLAGMERVRFTGRIITAAHGAVVLEVRAVRPVAPMLRAVPA
jgi:hypothetical protein